MKSILSKTMWVLAFLAFVSTNSFAEVPQEKEWSVLVFLNGDNNLDSFGTRDMIEMEKVGSNDKINIIVLRDTSKSNVSSKIYYVQKGSSKVVKDYASNIDMGNWQNLVEFFRWAKTNYPAKRYLIDIWNHGAGWERKNLDDIVTRGISYDDNSGNHITTAQLGEAFKQMTAINGGKRIDILGMDACLMEMAEVIYEVKDGAKVVVGSEEVEPGDGWAYEFLGFLVNKPTMEAPELATILEREYVKSYSGGSQGNQPAQGSAVSTDGLVAANAAFNRFLDHLIPLTALYNKPISQAVAATQDYYMSQYKDMIHFLKLVKDAVPNAELGVLADQAITEFEAAIIGNFVNSSTLGNSHGFAVWIPSADLFRSKKDIYENLFWGKETRWAAFLNELLFPSKPILEVLQTTVTDENGDGLITAGEKINLSVLLHNSSQAEGKNITVRVFAEKFGAINDSVYVPSVKTGATPVTGLSLQIPTTLAPGVYSATVAVDVPGMGVLEKNFSIGVDKDYTVEAYNLESAHPYANYSDETRTIKKEGAAAMRIHFARIDTEARYDFIHILDANGKLIIKLDGKHENLWSPLIEGDTVKVRFTSDNAVTEFGFIIDQIAY